MEIVYHPAQAMLEQAILKIRRPRKGFKAETGKVEKGLTEISFRTLKL
jgi:hypothetical protein